MDGAFDPSTEGAQDAPDDRASDLGLAGWSLPMERLRRDMRRFAPLPAPVLVTGETGTGKELVARALHDASPRSRGPYVSVNAGALPATLIASELFGHERGSFTGAASRHRGLFEQAHGGSLFMDEIAELPLDLQASLLRVLETGEVRAVGAERVRRVDVRVIAATNVALDRAVASGKFRHDLYWRLAVLTIEVPPLRARTDDIAALAAHFLASFRLDESRTVGPDALQALVLHRWPGNVRELRSVLLRATAISPRISLSAEDVVTAIGPTLALDAVPTSIEAALLATRGNQAAAARLLGVPRSTLRDRIERAATQN
jgi:DNA-binding NtrC family response regulator